MYVKYPSLTAQANYFGRQKNESFKCASHRDSNHFFLSSPDFLLGGACHHRAAYSDDDADIEDEFKGIPVNKALWISFRETASQLLSHTSSLFVSAHLILA